jgi:hypothetical protein
MFSSMKDFSSATKLLFKAVRSNKKMTISQFREQMATQFTIYNSLAAFQASFDTTSEANKEFMRTYQSKLDFHYPDQGRTDIGKSLSKIRETNLEEAAKSLKEATSFIEEHRRTLIDGNMRLMARFETLVKNYYNERTEDNINIILDLFDEHLEINPCGNETELSALREILVTGTSYQFTSLDSEDTLSPEFGQIRRLSKEALGELKDTLSKSPFIFTGKASDIDENSSLMAALLHEAIEDNSPPANMIHKSIGAHGHQGRETIHLNLHDEAHDGDMDNRLTLSEIYDLFLTSNIEVFNNNKNAWTVMHDDHIEIKYRVEDGMIEDKIYFNQLETYTTNGDTFSFETEIEGHIELKFIRNYYAKVLNSNHSFVRVALEDEGYITENKVFISNVRAEDNVKKEVKELLEANASNADEYTSEHIDEIIQDGSERINTKRIIIKEI